MDYVEGWEKRERKNHIMRLTKQLRKNKMLYGVAWAKGREAVAVSSLTGIQQFKCRQLGVPGLLIQEYPHDQTLACNQHWSCTTGKEMSPWEFWDQPFVWLPFRPKFDFRGIYAISLTSNNVPDWLFSRKLHISLSLPTLCRSLKWPHLVSIGILYL